MTTIEYLSLPLHKRIFHRIIAFLLSIPMFFAKLFTKIIPQFFVGIYKKVVQVFFNIYIFFVDGDLKTKLSFIFKFCGTHRLSLHYVSLITVLSIIDYYIGIPLSNIGLYYLYSIITGIFITLWIYVWYKNRNNPKIDYIKQLCDNYTDCNCK